MKAKRYKPILEKHEALIPLGYEVNIVEIYCNQCKKPIVVEEIKFDKDGVCKIYCDIQCRQHII